MRVTNSMITNQTLFFTQRSLSEFLRLQTQMTTSRRVNVPSDDPIGVQRSAGYRSTLKDIEQYRQNIAIGENLLLTYDSDLGEMKNILQNAAEIALAVNDDSVDSPEAVQAFVSELQSNIDRMLQLANRQIEGRYIFSGHRTNVAPIISAQNGFTYVGDSGQMLIEIDKSVQSQINVTAAETLFKELIVLGQDADLNLDTDAATLLAELNAGVGVQLGQFTIRDNNLAIAATIDLNVPAPAATIADAVAAINSQLTAAGITNLTAQVGTDANIKFVSTTNGLITPATALSNIRSGAGVDQLPGGFRIHDAGGTIDVTVNIANAVSIGDVLTAINTQLSAAGVNNVTASINATQTGINITDTNGVALDLSVSETDAGQTTASDLGILGFIGAQLVGASVSPQVDFSVSDGVGQTAANLGIRGSFHGDFAGTNLDPILTATTPLSRLQGGLGLTRGIVKVTLGAQSRQIDLTSPAIATVGDLLTAFNNSGLNITASINNARTGIQIRSNSTTESFIIEEIGVGRAARDLGVFGASDLMGALLSFKNQIASDGATGTQKDKIDPLLAVIQNGVTELLGARGSIGAKHIRLEATDARHRNAEQGVTELLSEIEDADITELVTQLASKENNYRASLAATAKIIQPSLLDFLR